MAGYNTRFHDVGFDKPKYLLPWKESIVICDILKSFGLFNQVIIVANKRDHFFKQELHSHICDYLLSENDLLYIPDTRGQAETAAIGVTALKEQNIPLFIHNADTILKGRDFAKILSSFDDCDGFIDTFIASSNAYSYVIPNGNLAEKIVEKKAISPFASSGLYGFKSSDLFSKYFHKADEQFATSEQKELYISNVIQLMLSHQHKFFIDSYSSKHITTVLGTPQEYGLEVTKNILLNT